MALHNSSTLTVTNELDVRIRELYTACSEDVKSDINTDTEKAIKAKAKAKIEPKIPVKTSAYTPDMSKLDNLIFDMNIEGAKIIAVQDNKNGSSKTCMYFPWEGIKKGRFDGGFYTVEEVFESMKEIGGGWTVRIHNYEGTDKNHYKGWSNCRVCDCKNGSADYTISKHLVPDGAVHYHTKHKLPLNLFSLVCGSKRVFYVAKKPFKQIKDAK